MDAAINLHPTTIPTLPTPTQHCSTSSPGQLRSGNTVLQTKQSLTLASLRSGAGLGHYLRHETPMNTHEQTSLAVTEV